MHTVLVLALPGTIAFDLATPIEVLGRVRLPGGRAGYRVLVCGSEPVVDAGPLRLAVDLASTRSPTPTPSSCRPVRPGRAGARGVRDALRAAAAAGTRIASICVGAFTLAAAGLLDGRRATTHWAAAERLQATFPAVRVDPEVLYVDTGQFVTSAGATAGVDMCLHLVRRDHGAAVAADASRQAVAPLHRDGGQAQFIVRPGADPAGVGLGPVLEWWESHADERLTLADVAARAGLSVRTLNRRFHEQTGRTPMQWRHRRAHPPGARAAGTHRPRRRPDRPPRSVSAHRRTSGSSSSGSVGCRRRRTAGLSSPRWRHPERALPPERHRSPGFVGTWSRRRAGSRPPA